MEKMHILDFINSSGITPELKVTLEKIYFHVKGDKEAQISKLADGSIEYRVTYDPYCVRKSM